MTKSILINILIITLLAISGCSGDEPTPTPEPTQAAVVEAPTGTIVAMGDSLTEGLGVDESVAYPAQLERKLQEAGYPYRIINAGISGETSSGARSRVDWVLTLEPDIVILETGPNDGFRGISTELTAQNIDEIINIFKQNDVIVVLAGMQIIQNLGDDYVTAFAELYPALAEKHGVALIPFFLEDVGGVRELNQEDGIHPTEEGYTIIVETLFPYVVEAIEHHQQ